MPLNFTNQNRCILRNSVYCSKKFRIPPEIKKDFRGHRTLDSEDRKVVVTCNEFAWVPVTTAGSTKFWLASMGVIQYKSSVMCIVPVRGSRSVQGSFCVKFLDAVLPDSLTLTNVYLFFYVFFSWIEFVGYSFAYLYRPFCIFWQMSGFEPTEFP